ncbi:DUF5076 domain-containing protein [Brevundimonas sp. NIBR11]|uniref:DUF5076 domain-containing protein n=1 Tax=Brevundimonas sp. NIBR11 TaxID=3015999 RepID=UPI0022F099D4|nr:DUF5076 domain-containing protein [Brevundimonas sp. NIBR11]WGM31144.1 hypothetical protein KKHFBJBL_01384 [Brevundimonas sp. NIBR11]
MSNEAPEFRLTAPESVASDPDAIEMLRFWWSRGEPVMVIKPAFDDPKTYGAILAIAARNIAYVYHANKGLDQEATYRQILAGLRQALEGPGYKTVPETDEPKNVQ